MGLAEKTRDYRGYTFFGELYGYTYNGQRIQDLTYGRKADEGPGLAIFDVLSPARSWLGPFERGVVCVDCELPPVPYLASASFDLAEVKAMAEGKSVLAPDQIREGVVVERIEGPRCKAKYVGEGYLTRKSPS